VTAEKIRIAISPRNIDEHGKWVFPRFDELRLNEDPGLEIVRLSDGNEIKPGELAGIDILVTQTTEAPVNATSLEGADRLKLVICLSIGHEHVTVPDLTARGIGITIGVDPIKLPTAVATVAQLLAATTRLIAKHELTKQGPEGWALMPNYDALHLEGRRLGIVGLGRIGQEVVRLMRPFNMEIVANDPYLDPAIAAGLGVPLIGIEELFETSDVVSLHTPLNDETRGFIGASLLNRMKPTAFLLNLSRGPVTDRDALYDVLKNERIAGAGLDVFHVEPTPLDDPITLLPNVTLSGHMLGIDDLMWQGLANHLKSGIEAFRAGRQPKHVENRAGLPADWLSR